MTEGRATSPQASTSFTGGDTWDDDEETSESTELDEDWLLQREDEDHFKSFERMTPVEDTPWAEFIVVTGHLVLWLMAFVLVQLAWWILTKSNVALSFLPVSALLIPVAFRRLRSGRYVGLQQVEGLEFLLHWLLMGHDRVHELLLGEPPDRRKKPPTFEKSMAHTVSGLQRSRRRGGWRYSFALAFCIVFFWVLVVGRGCWPCGYLYLVNYSFKRCQYACRELRHDTAHVKGVPPKHGKQAGRVELLGNATKVRSELMASCREGLGFGRGHLRPWHSDPHWLLQPEGAWVIGEPFRGHVAYNASAHDAGTAPTVDCRRMGHNRLVLTTVAVGAVLGGGAAVLSGRGAPLLVTATTALALLYDTGILGVWLGWVSCSADSDLDDRQATYLRLIDSCFRVANFNGTQYAAGMRRHGRKLLAYESNFRNMHQISRSEVWIGSLGEALLLLFVITAHGVFKHKRMQTGEARYQLMCRRPGLVRCLLQNADKVMQSLPPRDRMVMAWTVQRVVNSHPDRFQGLEAQQERLKAQKNAGEDLEGVSNSFWPTVGYSLIRTLIPSTYRQIVPYQGYESAVPEENSLWMLNALVRGTTSFMVFVFVLFQIKEASRHYTRTMQAWLAFESLWRFPSHCSLVGDPLTEIVQVHTDEDGERLSMFDRSNAVIVDFNEGPVQDDEAYEDKDSSSGEVVCVESVRTYLPIWWAWREYLIIDYADKRVRLELHLVVAIILLLTTSLLLILGDFKEGARAPQLLDANSAINWFEGHITSMSFQMTLDLLFLTPPVLHAISCAATMNRIIDSQLHKVVHLADILGEDGETAADASPTARDASPTASPGGESQAAKDDVGSNVRNIFRTARAHLASGGGSSTRLLSIVKINRQTLAIAGTTLSVFTGSQFVEIFDTVLNG